MRKATKNDHELVERLICESFLNNPSIMSIVNKSDNADKCLQVLAKYVFSTALSREGTFISSDNTGFAIFYKYNTTQTSLTDYCSNLELVITAIGMDGVLEIMKRDQYIMTIRPKSGDFFYLYYTRISSCI